MSNFQIPEAEIYFATKHPKVHMKLLHELQDRMEYCAWPEYQKLGKWDNEDQVFTDDKGEEHKMYEMVKPAISKYSGWNLLLTELPDESESDSEPCIACGGSGISYWSDDIYGACWECTPDPTPEMQQHLRFCDIREKVVKSHRIHTFNSS